MQQTNLTEESALAWIAALFHEAPERLKPETIREDIEEWDSLGVLTLLASLDSDHNIILNDEEVQGIRCVGDVLDILRRHGKLA